MEKIAILQEEADELKKLERKGVISRILEAIEVYGISPDELTVRVKPSGVKIPQTSAHPRRRGPQPARYVHPHTGQTWTGFGKVPKWLVNLERSTGKDRSEFTLVTIP